MALVDGDVAACALAYAEALLRHQAAATLPTDATLTHAASVIEARLGLYDCLIAHGWTPPGYVATGMERDLGLLRQPEGAIGG